MQAFSHVTYPVLQVAKEFRRLVWARLLGRPERARGVAARATGAMRKARVWVRIVIFGVNKIH